MVDLPSKYYQCYYCNQIEEASKWLEAPNQLLTCQHCDQIGENILWPPSEVLELLKFIQTYHQEAPEYGQVTSVFLSSVLELFLEELLTTMAYFDLSYDDASILVDALIDGYHGRSRMFALYKRVGYGPFHEAVKGLGFPKFLENWDTIVKIRNQVVHGKLEAGENIDLDLINTTIEEALAIFSQLHNFYNKERLRYRVATERKRGIEADLDRLNLWTGLVNDESETQSSEIDESSDD